MALDPARDLGESRPHSSTGRKVGEEIMKIGHFVAATLLALALAACGQSQPQLPPGYVMGPNGVPVPAAGVPGAPGMPGAYPGMPGAVTGMPAAPTDPNAVPGAPPAAPAPGVTPTAG